jgi:hypothetical protein
MVFRPSYHSGADGIPLNVTHSIPEMTFIHHNGIESVLPEMSAFGVPGIKVLRIRAVNVLKRPAQKMFILWYRDQMNMVAHQAPCPDPYGLFQALCDELFDVDVPVDVIQKDVCSSISAMCHVMR